MNKYRVFEVIIQERAERNPMHVGSVRSPNEKLALHSAREIFARRENCYKLSVVERKHIHSMEDKEFLGLAKEKSYRQPSVKF